MAPGAPAMTCAVFACAVWSNACPVSHRYRVTQAGQRVALCYCRGQRRVLSPALSAVFDDKAPPALGRLVERFDDHIDRLWQGERLAA